MAKRTQIVCIHEGKRDSIDPIFVNAFLKAYKPEWIRPYNEKGLVTGTVYCRPCGGKAELLQRFPQELKYCIAAGGNTTLMVLADIDDRFKTGDELKKQYWEAAKKDGITQEMFDKVVFIFPRDRIENWIQYLSTGVTDESMEGPRVKDHSKGRDMARLLADKCRQPQQTKETFPPSLEWSCRNWKALVERMR